MSNRWPGGIVRKTPVVPAGPYQNGAAPGVWTLPDAAYWVKQGLWPIAGNIADGTLAIFALGQGAGTLRNKYTYSGCVVSAGGTASQSSQGGSAAGNMTNGIFALGRLTATSTYITNRDKYVYTGCVVSAGGAASTASGYGAAAGNSTVGIFALGFNGSCSIQTRDKYTYSGCVVSSATSSTSFTYGQSATGNSTVGIFQNGAATNRQKYTYSGDTVGAATAATASTWYGAAVGNSTVGIFTLGTGQCATRDKYTYSGDTVTSATSASAKTSRGSAAGNSTTGIFALGYLYVCCIGACNSTTRNKYTYSGDVNASATAATNASSWGSAAGNGTSNVNT